MRSDVSYTYETIDDYLAPPDIHAEALQPLDGMALTLVVGTVLAIGHALNAYYLFGMDGVLILALLFHLILCACAAAVVWVLDKADRDSRFAGLYFLTSLTLGVFGAVGSILTGLMTLFYRNQSLSFDEWYNTIFPRVKLSLPEEIYDELEMGRDEHPRDYSVISFNEIMLLGNEDQKRAALTRIGTRFTPAFTPAIKQGLRDDSSTIRILAATTVSKIENQFHERLMRIETLNREYPDNPVILKALAEHLDDYAFLGILDPEREVANRAAALRVYRQYLQLQPGDMEARRKVGRLLLRGGNYQEARDWLQRMLQDGHFSESVVLWYFESLFKLGEYDALRRAAQTYQLNLQTYRALQPEIVRTIELWTGSDRLREAA